jgi:hypothetical protein
MSKACPICKENEGMQSCSNQDCKNKICFSCSSKIDGYCCEGCRSSCLSLFDVSTGNDCCHSKKSECEGSIDPCDRKGCPNWICEEHRVRDATISYSYCSKECEKKAVKDGHKGEHHDDEHADDWWNR